MKTLHANERAQRWIGLAEGVAFGFLLQRGGVTHYDTIIGQLRLTDFTVVKVMLSAVVVGMVGVYGLRSLGLARLHPKPGSVGMTVIGGLIFGVGFAVLGYCPGTIAGAIGQGALDALFGGLLGIVLGAGLFAALYPRLHKVLNWGSFGEITWPELLRVNAWVVVLPVVAGIVALLYWIESVGL
jgi:hypothetical protein